MKHLLSIALACTLITGCDSSAFDPATKDYYTEFLLPRGAKVIEWIPTKNQNFYVIFELYDQCFLHSRMGKQSNLANINCPTEDTQ